MTALRINTVEFKQVCKLIRDDISFFDASEESIYSFYRWYVKDFEGRILSAPADPADDLRAALRVASRAAMEHGASQAQIDLIVSLARKSGNFNVLGSQGRLTKKEAGLIIDAMKE